MSSFVRRAAPAAVPADPGTRPGLHGQTLISTGLADLDKILGGGLPLGSILLVLEHPWSAHHQTLLKYFVAEGVACGHAVHWAVPRLADGGVTSMLPKQITPKDAAQQKEQDERSKKEDEVQLRIAWQYRRYIKSKQKADAKADSEPGTSASPRRAGSSFQRKGAAGSGSAVAAGLAREWCHHYDLTKPMAEEQVRDSRLDCQAHSGDDALDSVAFAAESLVCSVSGRPAPDRQSWGWTATATPKPKPKLSRREQVEILLDQILGPNRQKTPSQQAGGGESAGRPDSGAGMESGAGTSQGPTEPANAAHSSGSAPQAVGSGSPSPDTSSRQPDAAPAGIALAGQLAQATLGSKQNAAASTAFTTSSSAAHTAASRDPDATGSAGSAGAAQGGLAAQDGIDKHAASSEGSEGATPGSSDRGTASTAAAGPSVTHLAGTPAQPRPPQPTAPPPAPPVAPVKGPAGVGRLAISSLANADWELLGAERPELERQLMRLLFRIKGLLRESRCAAMVSIPAGSFSPALALRLQHFCDAVLQLESVGDDSDIVRLATDSPSVHGVLHVRKLPGLHTLVRPQPLVSLYVIRNKRRRIHIEGFQVDPDAEAAEADAAAGGAKSAASMMCAGPPNASKALDF